MRVLILGGTAEARALAVALDEYDVVSSLAGRVQRPAMPVGEVRVGGFGGVAGLREYARAFAAVVDATHPFAEQISANARDACAAAGVPLLRLARPGWASHPDADRWDWVGDTAAAAQKAEVLGERVFITTGRTTLPVYARLRERYCLVRVVDPPTDAMPAPWEILLARGPFDIGAERDLMASRDIDVVVTKDSGGAMTQPKLLAAGELGIRVVVIARPTYDSGHTVDNVDDAVAWVRGVALQVEVGHRPDPSAQNLGMIRR